VRISGIKIGSIVGETLDSKTFLARLRLSIDPSVKLPDDTVAEIVSAGLLGDKYLSLVPGGSETLIPAGGQIKYTQSSVTLENLIGQMIFSSSGSKKPAEGEAPSEQQGQPQAAPGGAAPKR
jgi:phospholipid/cholesterol/gamma-HCH transport system substrate-binding protein